MINNPPSWLPSPTIWLLAITTINHTCPRLRSYTIAIQLDNHHLEGYMNLQPTNFWGKARLDPVSGVLLAWHPLAEHCLDVACTFRALVALPVIRRRLEAAAGRSLIETDLDRLAVFALLHDVGKPNRGFQEKILFADAPRAGHIRELAPLFAGEALSEQLAVALEVGTLAAWFADPNECEALLLAAISHHGTPIRFD
ncbi:MAG: CRISPR-associated endonuclease Cas3'', partial [Candidatus Contendobacter sp.]|nr:CRISPR-associated endonuclease Cas3'' [Candidatus Contendobacter sp.]